jgi:vacuolar-type H+-ATPase subunit I/STV1
MFSIVFGLIALCLGFWGIIRYWWYMADVLIAILPLVLVVSGAIALMAGIRNTGMRTSFKLSKSAPTTHKKDE